MVIRVTNSTDRIINLSEVEAGDQLLILTREVERQPDSWEWHRTFITADAHGTFRVEPQFAPPSLVKQIHEYAALLLDKRGNELYDWMKRDDRMKKSPSRLYQHVIKEIFDKLTVTERTLQIGCPLQINLTRVLSWNTIDGEIRRWSPPGVIGHIKDNFEKKSPIVEAARIQAELAL